MLKFVSGFGEVVGSRGPLKYGDDDKHIGEHVMYVISIDLSSMSIMRLDWS